MATRRNWMVMYAFDGGGGRCFVDTPDVPLSKELVLEMDIWVKENTDGNYVTSVTPLDTFKVEE